MRGFLSIISVVGVTWGLPQLQFGGPTDADTRSFSEAEIQPSGRVPGGASVAPAPSVQVSNEDQCCCIPADQDCFDLYPAVDDLVGQGLIDPRIVNRPPAQPHQLNTLDTCPAGYKTCCYAPDLDLSVFQRNNQCISPYAASQQLNQHHHNNHYGESWIQGCQEAPVYGSKTCGTRSYAGPVAGLSYGQSSPGEFPWTCILLNQNNDFVGTCAIITEDFSNNNNAPTRKVLTAAHKVKDIGYNDLLKVRVGEWDASGFNSPERHNHEEYSVIRILEHPDMLPGRLSDNIALLYVDRDINLTNPYVNTACLPSDDNQFDHIFANETGEQCHVASWVKDEVDGTFHFIPRKVDLSLVPDNQCEAKLKTALNLRNLGVGDRFKLHPSEVCAGGEVGKDACIGDGGSPLVCQAQSGRWTVVGLVSWGIGCASDIPGVYVKVSHYRDWINAN